MRGCSASFVQFLIFFLIAAFLFIIERSLGTNIINKFITEQGLLAIAALVALNSSAVIYLVTRLISLEEQADRPYFFDEVKAEAWHAIKEQMAMLSTLYILLSISPESCWNMSELPKFHCWTLSSIPGIMSRACLLLAFYSSYDVTKSMIICSMDPKCAK